MASTDDKEIAETSKQYNAKISFYKSAETSNDFATTMDVLREIVDEYRKRNRMFESLCCIYPTAPFVTGLKIRDEYDTRNMTKLIETRKKPMSRNAFLSFLLQFNYNKKTRKMLEQTDIFMDGLKAVCNYDRRQQKMEGAV